MPAERSQRKNSQSGAREVFVDGVWMPLPPNIGHPSETGKVEVEGATEGEKPAELVNPEEDVFKPDEEEQKQQKEEREQVEEKQQEQRQVIGVADDGREMGADRQEARAATDFGGGGDDGTTEITQRLERIEAVLMHIAEQGIPITG
jgi:hypothetical protein